MSSSVFSRNGADPILAELIEQITDKLQKGEPVDLEAHIAKNPEHAEELRKLLPALHMLAVAGSVDGLAPREGEQTPVTGALGDFRIIRELGRGGMGVVYEAEQISLGRRVALKVLPFAATMDPRQLQRFQNEARAAACLHHNHIVPVYFVGCERGVHFYAMQLIQGKTLAAMVHDLNAEGTRGNKASMDDDSGERDEFPPGTISPPATTAPQGGLSTQTPAERAGYYRQVAQWGIQAAEALDYAHQMGVVHRDIKPGNLMLDARGEIWVTDFGLAQVQQAETNLTLTGDLVGTLRYMSPEQALGKRAPVDHRTDVYSLGVTLYELLTLQPVFAGQDRQELLRQIAFEQPRFLRQIDPSIPPELETIVLKSKEKNPQERYATTQELADDLQRFLEDKPIRARRPTFVQRLRKLTRRHRVVVIAAVVCLIVTLTAAIGSVGWVMGDQSARRHEAEAKVREALDTAVPRLEQGNPWDPALVTAVKTAEAQMNSTVVGPELRSRVKKVLRDIDMLTRLEAARSQAASSGSKTRGFDYSGADRLYAEAFQWYGLDATAPRSSSQGAVECVRGSAICTGLIVGLDHWASVRDRLIDDGGAALRALADQADSDSWRHRRRRATGHKDRAALERLAEEEGTLAQAPVSLLLLATALVDNGSAKAERLLRRAQHEYPTDFWINFTLADFLSQKRPQDAAETIRFYQAALALRPRFPTLYLNLGVAFFDQGKWLRQRTPTGVLSNSNPISPRPISISATSCPNRRSIQRRTRLIARPSLTIRSTMWPGIILAPP